MLTSNPDVLSYEQSLGVLQDVAIGMAHIHTEKILHRDIAARNVLLATSNEVLIAKVTDFGLGKIFAENHNVNSTALVGPVRWMAPETLKERIWSFKSDTWSFGVLCWEVMHAGKQPFAEVT